MLRWLFISALVLALVSPLAAQSKASREADFVFISAVDTKNADPQKMTWNHDIRLAGCLWEPLVRHKLPELAIEPAAAESWEVSADLLTYTFHIRPGARWSNGDPVTARDFLAAWRRALSPDFAADYAQLFFCIKGAESFFTWRSGLLAEYAKAKASASPPAADSRALWNQALEHFSQTVAIKAPDDRTLVVTLNQPTPYFLDLCAFAPFFPNHAPSLEKLIAFNPDSGMADLPAGYWTDPQTLITNGPYQLKRHRFKQDILLTQNPHYWNKAAMGNKSILQRTIENPQTQMLAYQRGEAHWLPDIPTTLSLAADLVASKREDVHLIPWAGTYFYSFNCNPTFADGAKNPLHDPRVRRALALTIDRQTLVDRITRLHQPVARSFIPPDALPAYQPPVAHGAGFDPVLARQLLAEAGYPEPAKLTGLSILYNTGGGHEAIAQAIKRMWEQHLGIIVALEALEVRSFGQRFKTQQYAIARASWIGDYPDPTTFLEKYEANGGNNDARFTHPRYDALLAQARTQADPAQRLELLQNAEALLLDEAPIAPIYHYRTLHVFNTKVVRNLHLNAWNFFRLEQVTVGQ